MNKPNWPLWLLLALAFVLSALRTPRTGPDLSMGGQCDASAIIQSVQSSASPWKWWTGPWVNTITAYHRPIPSTLWWVLHSSPLWSPAGFWVVTWLSHLACAIVAVLAFRRLVGTNAAILGATVWVSGILEFVGLPGPSFALTEWINVVDVWAWIGILATLWALGEWIESGHALPWLPVLMISTLLAALTKELAYMLPALAFVQLIGSGHLKTHWAKLVPMVGGLVVCFFWRSQVVPPTHPTIGPDGMLLRLALYRQVAGDLGENIAQGRWVTGVVPWAPLLAWIAVCAALIKAGQKPALASWTFGLLAAVPLGLGVVGLYGFYGSSLGWAMAIGSSTLHLIDRPLRKLGHRRARQREVVAAGEVLAAQ